MESLEGMEDMQQLSPDQMDEMKVALLETLRDAQKAGLFEEDPQKSVEAAKVGMAEVVKDLGGGQQQPQGGEQEVTQSRVEETGKDGKKTKTEVKVVSKT